MAEEEEEGEPVWTALSQVPYLGPLALLVLLGTSSAAALDFLFKSQAREVYGKGRNYCASWRCFIRPVRC